MATREIETKFVITDKDKYLTEIHEITDAVNELRSSLAEVYLLIEKLEAVKILTSSSPQEG